MINKKLILFAFLFFLIATAKAQDYNETLTALEKARADVKEMEEIGFSIIRVNDTLSEAEQLFSAQKSLEQTGGKADYSLILLRTTAIAELKKKAIEVYDELKALEIRMEGVEEKTESYAIFVKAKKEFADERYDETLKLIEECYVKISEEQALETKLRVIAIASTKTIVGFFKRNWLKLSIFAIALFLIYLFSHKRVAIWLIDRKINNLKFEKEVLKGLIKKAQDEYFQLFKISEELYHIRITKFGELIRDIDRQIPLLVEEREKIKARRKKEEKKKKLNQLQKKKQKKVEREKGKIRKILSKITLFLKNIKEKIKKRRRKKREKIKKVSTYLHEVKFSKFIKLSSIFQKLTKIYKKLLNYHRYFKN